MTYTAVMDIDDDRWAKHPYGITIKDDNGNVVYSQNFLDSREACYRIAIKYGIARDDIKDVFY